MVHKGTIYIFQFWFWKGQRLHVFLHHEPCVGGLPLLCIWGGPIPFPLLNRNLEVSYVKRVQLCYTHVLLLQTWTPAMSTSNSGALRALRRQPLLPDGRLPIPIPPVQVAQWDQEGPEGLLHQVPVRGLSVAHRSWNRSAWIHLGMQSRVGRQCKATICCCGHFQRNEFGYNCMTGQCSLIEPSRTLKLQILLYGVLPLSLMVLCNVFTWCLVGRSIKENEIR